MSSIISDIYNGTCRGFAASCSEAYREQQKEVGAVQEAFEKMLTEEQLRAFNAYLDAKCDLDAIENEDNFIEGVRFGVRLMAESMKIG